MKAHTDPVPRLALTVRETAASLGTSVGSVRAMIRRKELRPLRVGFRQTKQLIPMAQIHAMLAERAEGEGSGGDRETEAGGWDYRLPRAGGGSRR